MFVVVVISLLVFGFTFIAAAGKKKVIEARRKKLLEWARPHVKDELFISTDATSLIGFDFAQKNIYLACAEYSNKYRFDQIASCELLNDNVSVTQTNRGSQVLGAVVGDVLLGPAGLLIGGMTGSKRTSTRLSKIVLKVVVDCQRNPVYRITLFESSQKKGAKSNDPLLRPHLSAADRFHGHVLNGMRNAERDERAKIAMAASQPAPFPTKTDGIQHLKELYELKVMGAITDNEFEAAKVAALKQYTASSSSPLPPLAVDSKSLLPDSAAS